VLAAAAAAVAGLAGWIGTARAVVVQASLDESANTIVERLAASGLFTKTIVYKDTDDCTVLKSNIETKPEDLMYVVR